MATDEQTQQTLQKLKETLSELAKIKPEDLVREEDLGRELSFRSGLPYFERTLQLFHALEKSKVEELPYSVLSNIHSQAEAALRVFKQVQLFSVAQHSSPTSARDSFINQIRDGYDSYFSTVAPWLAYLAQRRPDLEALDAQARKVVTDLQKFAEEEKTRQQETTNAMDGILESVRRAAAEVGVAQHAVHFKEEADVHKGAAWKWLTSVVAFGVVAAFYAWWSFGHAPNPPEGSAVVAYYVHYAVPRVIILTILFYGLIWSGRNYSSHRHNEVLNRHRQNALRTFETFVKAATDNPTKDAVLLRATEAIFTPQATGYISPEAQVQVPSTMIEVLRGATERK